jgi:hypothetical protein
MTKKLPPVHPGEELREEFPVPIKLSPLRRGPCGWRAAHPHRAFGGDPGVLDGSAGATDVVDSVQVYSCQMLALVMQNTTQ